MSDILLSVENLQTHFGSGEQTVRAVDNVSFEIKKGETFALLGESGCGKSMTSMSIMRLVPEPAGRVVSGSVKLDGQDLLSLPEVAMRKIRGGRIAMIFQEPMTSLNPVMTVGKQIEESVEIHQGLKGAAAKEKVLSLLDAVGIPDSKNRYSEYPHQLSGGMKQRIMIAIALAGDPELLIADEPTTALDVTIQAQVLTLLGDIQKKTGMAILLITHDLGIVSDLVDRVAVMYAGQIVEIAPRDEFFDDPKHPYTRKLFESVPTMGKRGEKLAIIRGSVPSLSQVFTGCRFEPRCDFSIDACKESIPDWVGLNDRSVRCHLEDKKYAGKKSILSEMNGVAELVAKQSASKTDQVTATDFARHDNNLHAQDIKVHFPIHKGFFKRVVGHVKAVDGVSLEISPGRTLALVGESGCGKTTVAKSILQLIKPTAGSVVFDGKELTTLSRAELRAYRSDIQIIFQDPYSSMNPRMMVRNIISEGMVAQNILPDPDAREKRVDELLNQVGLSPDLKHRYPHEFSGGQRQRICIARALAVNPKLIICDEPTSALDVSVQAQILNLLKQLQTDLGMSYLFITHNISVVEYLADEVAVMYLGRIVEQGAVESVLTDPRHPYTRALLSAVPTIDKANRKEIIKLEGELPSPSDPPQGCHFHPRCAHAKDECRQSYPDRADINEHQWVRCFLY